MPLRAGGAARHRDPGLNELPRTFVRVHGSVREHSTDRPACCDYDCNYNYDYDYHCNYNFNSSRNGLGG